MVALILALYEVNEVSWIDERVRCTVKGDFGDAFY